MDIHVCNQGKPSPLLHLLPCIHANDSAHIRAVSLKVDILAGTAIWHQPATSGTPPRDRFHHTCVAVKLVDHMLVVFGGETEDGTLLNDTHFYDVGNGLDVSNTKTRTAVLIAERR
jgi:hypothetical protein